MAAVYPDFVVLHCIPALLCHPSSSGSEQDGQVCVESNCSGFCWKPKVEGIQCAECAGVGALCLGQGCSVSGRNPTVSSGTAGCGIHL